MAIQYSSVGLLFKTLDGVVVGPLRVLLLFGHDSGKKPHSFHSKSYRLLFFRSTHLLHHSSKKKWFFSNCSFYCLLLPYLEDTVCKNNHDVIFVLNDEVNECFWKRTTCTDLCSTPKVVCINHCAKIIHFTIMFERKYALTFRCCIKRSMISFIVFDFNRIISFTWRAI